MTEQQNDADYQRDLANRADHRRVLIEQEFKKLKKENERLKDELSNLPIQHKSDCDTQMCSIICGRCTCGAKQERDILLGRK